MKYAYVFLSLLFSPALSAQQGSPAQHEAAREKLVALYNRQAFDSIHTLLSPDFKKAMPSRTLVVFFRDNIYATRGMWLSAEKLRDDPGMTIYLAQFEKGSLEMSLAVNPKGEIYGLQFLPPKKKAVAIPSEVRNDNPLRTSIDSIVDTETKNFLARNFNRGLRIAVVHKGKTYTYGYGETVKGNDIIPHDSTIFEIGSLTKTFTALLLAQALEEKRVSEDDDVRKHLEGKFPNLEYKGQPIRLKHLANHTSGLPRLPADLEKQPKFDALDPYRNYSEKMLLSYLQTAKPDTTPGARQEYSNLGVAVLGLALEKIYGKSYEQLVKEKITAPFALSSTTFEDNEKRMAAGYDEHDNKVPYWRFSAFAPAGALRSDMHDMRRYLDVQMKADDPAVRRAQKETTREGPQAVGLGWMITQGASGKNLIWHNGGTFGFSSFLGFMEDRSTGIIILSNSGKPVDMLAMQLLRRMQKLN